VTLLVPVLGAGLGLLVGARQSARVRGGVLGALAGATLAVMAGGALFGVEQARVTGDPNFRRRAAYAEVVRALEGVGKHADAARAAQEYAREFPDEPEVAYHAAGHIARCVPLAERDPKLSAAERQKAADEYGRLAVQQLRAAVAAGYRDVKHMQADRDLDPLRGRQDFRDLLAELGAGP
jgi:hypothetical protein